VITDSTHRQKKTILVLLISCWIVLGTASLRAHVVSQLYAEWQPGTPWEMELWFDAGYAVPEWRGDEFMPAPQREWLVELGEEQWKQLRTEAERYLRESLVFSRKGEVVQWDVSFPDFETIPPDFPVRMNGGAYFRMRLSAADAAPGALDLKWMEGERPTLVVRLPGAEASYLTFTPGQTQELEKAGRLPWLETFRQGFLHVLPAGLDHVLFVMGLFFYRRAWRPLVAQSLAFTAAHTMTLGFAAVGWIRISGSWVEPVIALSLVAVALENLRQQRQQSQWLRLAIVFGFGLIHGLGFAGALSTWLQPGDGFLTALISANLGVEVAQVALLAAAWLLTLRWHHTAAFEWYRVAGSFAIAMIGGFWVLERTGVIG
jgi:hypothetical protein